MKSPKFGMFPFIKVFPELALRETGTLSLPRPENGLPADEYAFIECYCVDPKCDCRRVLLQVWSKSRPGVVLATINYGWETEEFYTEWTGGDAEAAREITRASLDPLNAQSKYSDILLRLFQEVVRQDPPYIERLAKHYRMFREAISAESSDALPATQNQDPHKIPKDRRQRFKEVADLIEDFAREHLDEETAGFCLELWTRLCRQKAPDAMRGKPETWAASAIHVIARMNFLFDKSQPVHLTFDTICDFFQTSKTTVGGKATRIEKTLKLRQHNEPGLCRRKFIDMFTNVQLSNGIVMTLKMAKDQGLVPPDAMP